MNTYSLIKRSLLDSLGVAAYVLVISWIMTSLSGQNFPQTVLGPMMMLMLLVLSVAVVGMLIFAKPVMMYLDGQKKESVWLIIYTLIWLAVFILISLFIVSYWMA